MNRSLGVQSVGAQRKNLVREKDKKAPFFSFSRWAATQPTERVKEARLGLRYTT